MKNYIKNAINSTGRIIKDGISVPITSKMFSSVLKSQTEKIEAEGIYNVEVLFIDNYIKAT